MARMRKERVSHKIIIIFLHFLLSNMEKNKLKLQVIL